MSNPIELVSLSTSPELLNQFNSMSSTVEKVEKGTIWYNGMKYVGEYKIGCIKHGYGVLYKNGKIVYEGEWKNNQRNGKGIEYNQNGEKVYEGEWINGEKINQ
jgi:hypothetical protein